MACLKVLCQHLVGAAEDNLEHTSQWSVSGTDVRSLIKHQATKT